MSLLRPLGTPELSDGTLRYLLLIAVLLTPRPPELMVLNEPETSLHPDLLAPLARLIARACERSQLIVVTHSSPLIAALHEQAGCYSIVLEKSFGETSVTGATGGWRTGMDLARPLRRFLIRSVTTFLRSLRTSIEEYPFSQGLS